VNSPQMTAPTIAEGWASAAEYLLAQPSRDAVNLAVKIGSPLEGIRTTKLIDSLLREKGLPSVGTVANTIFPRRLAARSSGPSSLTQRYRHLLPRLKRNPKNRTGLYFERMVAFETAGHPIDQLESLIDKLRAARTAVGGAMSSRYEIAIYDPLHDHNKMRGFPCLSFLSFHLHEQHLHLGAYYRNHNFVERAYGNYVGLGGLLSYVAAEASWQPGEMLIVSGHASIERGAKGYLTQVIEEIRRSALSQA
jgi:hypothetical protein